MKSDHRADLLVVAHQTEMPLLVGSAQGPRPVGSTSRFGEELDLGLGHRLAIQQNHPGHLRELRLGVASSCRQYDQGEEEEALSPEVKDQGSNPQGSPVRAV
jgi:hypothetical protein